MKRSNSLWRFEVSVDDLVQMQVVHATGNSWRPVHQHLGGHFPPCSQHLIQLALGAIFHDDAVTRCLSAYGSRMDKTQETYWWNKRSRKWLVYMIQSIVFLDYIFFHNNLFHSAQEFSLFLFVSISLLCSDVKEWRKTILNGVSVLNKTDSWIQCKMCLLNISLSENCLFF